MYTFCKTYLTSALYLAAIILASLLPSEAMANKHKEFEEKVSFSPLDRHFQGTYPVNLVYEDLPIELPDFPAYTLTRKGRTVLLNTTEKSVQLGTITEAKNCIQCWPGAIIVDLNADRTPEIFLMSSLHPTGPRYRLVNSQGTPLHDTLFPVPAPDLGANKSPLQSKPKLFLQNGTFPLPAFSAEKQMLSLHQLGKEGKSSESWCAGKDGYRLCEKIDIISIQCINSSVSVTSHRSYNRSGSEVARNFYLPDDPTRSPVYIVPLAPFFLMASPNTPKPLHGPLPQGVRLLLRDYFIPQAQGKAQTVWLYLYNPADGSEGWSQASDVFSLPTATQQNTPLLWQPPSSPPVQLSKPRVDRHGIQWVQLTLPDGQEVPTATSDLLVVPTNSSQTP